jgi:hypothetical protein
MIACTVRTPARRLAAHPFAPFASFAVKAFLVQE